MNKYKNLSRRQLLSMFGGSAAYMALNPLIPRLEAAEADISSVKRYVYWHEFTMPEQAIVNANYQTNEGALNFRNSYTALNDSSIKNSVLFLRNVTRPQAPTGSQPHPSGAVALSGWRKLSTGYNPAATSVDQYLSKQLVGTTPIGDLRAGHRNSQTANEGLTVSTSVYQGVQQPRYQTPLAMYNDLFKGVATSNSGSGTEATSLLRQRRSVLDFMNDSINSLNSRVSHFDKTKIDAHLTAIRETEIKLENLLSISGSGIVCNDVSAPDVTTEHENIVYPIYSNLITSALSCNMTRVAGAHFGAGATNLRYRFLDSYNGNGASFHAATHGKHSNQQYQKDVLEFRAQQVANLLKNLNSVQEPDGNTLLDNTFFYWTTDVARNHNVDKDIHCVLAGAKDRLKQQGNMVRVNNANHNQILASICHFMGFDELSGYGDPKYGTGTLSSDLFV